MHFQLVSDTDNFVFLFPREKKCVGTSWNMQNQLDEVSKEVLQYQHTIKQLEDEVQGLELEYHEIQQNACLLMVTRNCSGMIEFS